MNRLRSRWRTIFPIIAVASVASIALTSSGAGTYSSAPPVQTVNKDGRPGGAKQAEGSAKGSAPASSSVGSPYQPPAQSAGGSDAQASLPIRLPRLNPIQARKLTAGSRIVKPGSSVQTDSIHPSPGGSVLVWVFDLVGGEAAPVPTVSGAGLGTLHLLMTATKKDDAPRRISLFVGLVPSRPTSGSLTIDFTKEINSSEWLWMVVQVSGRSAVQTASETAGDWVNTYTVHYQHATAQNDAALAGFMVGRNSQDMRAAQPMHGLAMVEGESPPATLYVEWTNARVSSARCDWQTPSHSAAIAVEIGT